MAKLFDLERAEIAARYLIKELQSGTNVIAIAGSIRRRKALVHDIDLVAIPLGSGGLLAQCFQRMRISPKGGAKILKLQCMGIPVDLYIATPQTWATLLLIRTGSKEHNIRLCRRARSKGMTLKANGEGLVVNDPDGKGESYPLTDIRKEQDIFKLLDLPYREPWER